MMRPELLSSQPKQLQHKPGAAGALHKVSRSQPKSTAVGTAAADVHRSLLLSMLTQGSPACQLLRHLIVKHRANHRAAGSSKSQRGCTNTWMSSEHLHSPPLPTQPPSGHLPLLRAAQLLQGTHRSSPPPVRPPPPPPTGPVQCPRTRRALAAQHVPSRGRALMQLSRAPSPRPVPAVSSCVNPAQLPLGFLVPPAQSSAPRVFQGCRITRR